MTDYVVDASIIAEADDLPEDAGTTYAPELIDLEVVNFIRKSVLRGQTTGDEADLLIAGWSANEVVRCTMAPHLPRIWSMRHNITPYDAAYVALAEYLKIPLVTNDLRLAKAAAHYCEVMTVG